MRVVRLIVAMAAVAMVTVGCSASPPARSTQSTPTGVASPAPSQTPAVVATPPDPSGPELTSQGAGPYRVGERVDKLVADGLLRFGGAVDMRACPELSYASAVGPYEGVVSLVVLHNVLVEVSLAGSGHTPEGAAVGMSWQEIGELYGERGNIRKSADGNVGYVVVDKDRVLLFTGHPIRPGVGAVAAGTTAYTLDRFLTGKPCGSE